MRIGLFGGSFNPIHNQHLEIAKNALIDLKLDQVWFLPVFKPVHKQQKELIAYHERRKLIEAAISNHKRFAICDAEKNLGGFSYTFRTVRYLQQQFPQHCFSLLIGGDSLEDLANWKNVAELVELVDFGVVSRPGGSHEVPVTNTNLTWINCPENSVSSTIIRKKLSRKDFLSLQLPNEVLFYIFSENLYGVLSANEESGMDSIRVLRENFPDGLGAHMRNVGKLCVELAVRYGINPLEAFLAGFNHDLFRASVDSEILKWEKFFPGKPTGQEKRIPMLLHGKACAGYLQKNNFFPDSVRQAIRFHTLPVEPVSALTMLLVVADTFEPGRGEISSMIDFKKKFSLEELFDRAVDIKRRRVQKIT